MHGAAGVISSGNNGSGNSRSIYDWSQRECLQNSDPWVVIMQYKFMAMRKTKKNVVLKVWLPFWPGSAKVINRPIQCIGLGGILFLPQGLRCNLLPRPCYAPHLAL